MLPVLSGEVCILFLILPTWADFIFNGYKTFHANLSIFILNLNILKLFGLSI